MENTLLNEGESRTLLSVAHSALVDSFSHLPSSGDMPSPNHESKYGGVFVTITKHGHLRGCMGEFREFDDIYEVVDQTARSAAFQDPRFAPLTKKELPDIEIEISLLSPLHQVNSIEEIEFGKHGVLLVKDEESGTFLPQVAREFKNKIDFLNELCKEKMDLKNECWLDPNMKIFVYTVQILK